MTTELETVLRRRIALAGPLTVAEFMVEALAHPALGYYRRARTIGAAGDFVTAPEISQMFGELIGAWFAERWLGLGRPDPVRFVELGPGRGTLLADMLRATRGVAGLHAALRLHLVEIDPTLRDQQQRTLTGSSIPVQWHEQLDDVPDDLPLLLVANEFFDALPVRQLVRTAAGWRERMIGAADDHTLGFAVAPGPSPLVALLDGSVRDTMLTGAVAEISPAALSLMHAIATRVERHRGAALVFDYGYESGSHGDTLQAVRGHARVGIFDRIGESDLTTHVDFAALARAAREAGAAIDGPVTQGAFLRELGIATRACVLQARASPTQAAEIESAMARLIAPDQMGTLFRVLAVRDRASSPASGFAPHSTALESSPGPSS